VSESAVIGVNHDIKGQALVAFVSLRDGQAPSRDLESALSAWVAKRIGKFAVPEKIIFAPDLPKTRSGKIMRRLLRDVSEHRKLGDVTTLANEEIVTEIAELAVTNPHEED